MRRRGVAFWTGLVIFCVACSLGFVGNLAISTEAYHHGVPWFVAGVIGVLFSAVWNYGVTSMTIWRRARRSTAQRAERRALAAANLQDL